MQENTIFDKEFLESEYYKKYENTDYDGKGTRKSSYANYEDAYNKIVTVMRDFFVLYYEKAKECNERHAKELLKRIYRDPDQNFKRVFNGVECSGDALVSLSRLIGFYEKFNSKIVDAYQEYRKSVIFYFPKEQGGINQARCSMFGDRIDCTLLDIKNYCENVRKKEKNKVLLINVYDKCKTKKWFEFFDYDFVRIVDTYKIKNIFTNENYDVYDLESESSNSLLFSFNQQYSYMWSKNYYRNVISKIKLYNKIV